MIFSRLLKTVFGFGRTDTAKSSTVNGAEESTQAEELEIAESAQNVSEKDTTSEVNLTMTEQTAKRKLVDWCKSQIGYHEGYDGSNKYADGQWDVKLYGFSAINVPWCDVFVDAAYIACFGYNDATAMTYQQPSGYAACTLSADAYKRNGAFYQTPEVGDQIFFFVGGGINHTGIVIEVNGGNIVCVEGNYSDSVMRTQYKVGDRNIAGYGRPNWKIVVDELVPNQNTFDDVDDAQFDIIHPTHRRTFLHLEYGDGVGNPLPQVYAWQNLLLCWGYDLGRAGADGEYGLDTENVTRQWQREAIETGLDVEVNGVVDEDDWIAIINIPG